MKTYRQLYHKITSWDNLLMAAKNATRGRQFNAPVAGFNFRLERELLKLQQELEDMSYQPGPYTTFRIHDPKARMISAAPFRDRVVHHALCNVIEPVFEKTFIFDSFANRKGKGAQRAIERYQYYARKYQYVLKCDVRKFFPSLDHSILKAAFRWKIQCPETLWLSDLILDNSNLQESVTDVLRPLGLPDHDRRGLPIGNLTSQFWANVYMNRFDHFVKETLQVPGYIRYVDDFVLFSKDKVQLAHLLEEIKAYLATLRLVLHPTKTHIHHTKSGVPFLGYRVWPDYRIAKKERVRRFRRHISLVLMQKPTNYQLLEQALNSWLGHIRFGQAGRLEYQVFWGLRDKGVNVLVHPRGSWRVLMGN
ncbi:MAG TPA: RNA-dependent DNA polymerase [Saprospirales bacterium]|nr:RNA-dependent DNA polymerase [Saprospirales bacterium]